VSTERDAHKKKIVRAQQAGLIGVIIHSLKKAGRHEGDYSLVPTGELKGRTKNHRVKRQERPGHVKLKSEKSQRFSASEALSETVGKKRGRKFEEMRGTFFPVKKSDLEEDLRGKSLDDDKKKTGDGKRAKKDVGRA